MSLVTFYIKGGAPSAQEKDTDKRAMRRGKTYIIKDNYLIADPRPGKSGQKTYVRYLPGETSVFVDEQKAKFDVNELRSSTAKTNAIKILERTFKVDTKRNQLLYEYLKVIPNNEENAEANGWAGTTFYEYKPSERSKNEDTFFNKDTDLRLEIRGLDLLTLKAVLRIMGSKTIRQLDDMDVHTMQHQLYRILSSAANKAETEHQYRAILADKLLSVKYDVYEAIDKGIIIQHPGDHNSFVLAATGVMINTAPQGAKPVDWFSEWLSYKGVDTLMMLRGYLGRSPKETPDGLEVKPKSEGEVLDSLLDYLFSEENKLTTMSGNHHMYEGKNGQRMSIGLGRAGVKRKILENKELRQEIFARFLAMNELAETA